MVWYDSTVIPTELQFQPIPVAATCLGSTLPQAFAQPWGHTSQPAIVSRAVQARWAQRARWAGDPWDAGAGTHGTPGVRWAARVRARCGWHIGNTIHLCHLRFSSAHFLLLFSREKHAGGAVYSWRYKQTPSSTSCVLQSHVENAVGHEANYIKRNKKKNNTPCSSAANSKEKTWPPQHLADT